MKHILILVIILVSCNKKEESKLDYEIRSYLENVSDSLSLAGLSVGYIDVKGNKKVYHQAYSDLENKIKLDDESIFQITSPAKTVTMLALLILENEGKLNLNEKLVNYLPAQDYLDPRINDITLKHILRHQSGLVTVDDYHWDPTIKKESFEAIVSKLKKSQLKFNPGEQFSYSSYAFDLLMPVIEKASGQRYEDFMAKSLYHKLEMKNTSSDIVDFKNENIVYSYSDSSKQRMVYPYNRDHLASSVVMSSTKDILNFLNFFIQNQQSLIRSEEFNTIFKESYETGWGSEITKAVGYAFFIGNFKNYNSAIHTGGRSGFRSSLFLLPEKGIAVVVLGNTNNTPVNQISKFITDLLLRF